MDEEKRRQILSTALRLFWKYGFRRVNMKEIAEAAGISRPGLYLYFQTKEAVFSEAIKHYAQALLEEIDRGMQGNMTPAEKLRFVFEVWAVRGFAVGTGRDGDQFRRDHRPPMRPVAENRRG